MSEKDWWNGLYDETGQLPELNSADTTQPREEFDRSGARERPLVSVSPENTEVNTSGQRFPAPAHSWGGKSRTPDPFLQDNPPHGTDAGNTPEEAAELRKHAEAAEVEPAPDPEPVVPPKPVEPPKADPAPDETKTTPDTPDDSDGPKGIKALLKVFAEKKNAVKEATGKAGKTVAEKTAPTRKVIGDAAHAVSPANSGKWSFLWSMGAAWSVSFQSLVALYDRTVSLIGVPQLMSGPQAMGWHLFEGPGHWFRDALQASWEAGAAPRLFFLAAIGVIPVVVAQFAERITHDGLRKLAGWLGYGLPVVWICGHSYIPSFGFRSWDELYLTGLAAAAWWGVTASRAENTTDFQKFLLRIPLASVMCGVVAYSPGAAF